ncbi:MAG: T9SS type A sorting domain-containing protein [Bacteroidales bacterium]|nr:T9SS type A sorting domain-containing protein [Bacteroidales bacterium]
MKKAITFLLVAIWSVPVFSQNYQCVNQDISYTFVKNDRFLSIDIDSVVYNTGFASYYNFPVIGGENWGGCLSGDWPSWIGRKIDIYPNGDHLFYNFNDEAILIKTQVNAGNTWTSYAFADGRYVTATVNSVNETEFLGLTDSVKVFTFQVKDSNGNNLSHDLNDKQLWISKHYGMVKALVFRLFPDLFGWDEYYYFDSVEELEVAGMSEPESGIQNLTIHDIYSFDIGDEFHLHIIESLMGAYTKNRYEIRTLTEKTWSGNTVELFWERCARENIIYHIYGDDTVIFYQDTIHETIDSEGFEFGGLNLEVPRYFVNSENGVNLYAWYVQYFDNAYDCMAKFIVDDGFYSVEPHDCIEQIITKDTKIYEHKYFLDGLGGPFWNYGDFGNHYSKEIVYYHTGNEEWGEPYNCDSLLTHVYSNQSQSDVVQVAPNPMSTETCIKFPDFEQQPVKISVFNLLGEVVHEEITTSERCFFRNEGIENGLYFIWVTSDTNVLGSCKLIIRR